MLWIAAVAIWLVLCLWFNRHKFWRTLSLSFFLAGCLMNLTAVAANHGKMPVMAYYDPTKAEDSLHTNMRPEHHLKFLTDVHGTPKWRYSLGDLVLTLGYPLMLVAFWRESTR